MFEGLKAKRLYALKEQIIAKGTICWVFETPDFGENPLEKKMAELDEAYTLYSNEYDSLPWLVRWFTFSKPVKQRAALAQKIEEIKTLPAYRAVFDSLPWYKRWFVHAWPVNLPKPKEQPKKVQVKPSSTTPPKSQDTTKSINTKPQASSTTTSSETVPNAIQRFMDSVNEWCMSEKINVPTITPLAPNTNDEDKSWRIRISYTVQTQEQRTKLENVLGFRCDLDREKDGSILISQVTEPLKISPRKQEVNTASNTSKIKSDGTSHSTVIENLQTKQTSDLVQTVPSKPNNQENVNTASQTENRIPDIVLSIGSSIEGLASKYAPKQKPTLEYFKKEGEDWEIKVSFKQIDEKTMDELKSCLDLLYNVFYETKTKKSLIINFDKVIKKQDGVYNFLHGKDDQFVISRYHQRNFPFLLQAYQKHGIQIEVNPELKTVCLYGEKEKFGIENTRNIDEMYKEMCEKEAMRLEKIIDAALKSKNMDIINGHHTNFDDNYVYMFSIDDDKVASACVYLNKMKIPHTIKINADSHMDFTIYLFSMTERCINRLSSEINPNEKLTAPSGPDAYFQPSESPVPGNQNLEVSQSPDKDSGESVTDELDQVNQNNQNHHSA